MTEAEKIAEELRWIPRKDGGPPIEGEEERLEGGLIILRHHLPGSHELETFIRPDPIAGAEITVFYDGELQLDAGPAEIIPDADLPGA